MTERSHKKGEIYQKDVKHWLAQCPILGFDAELFGDAYDATKKACTIGGIVFDFSLKLGRGDFTRHILYGECKYRNERQDWAVSFSVFQGETALTPALSQGEREEKPVPSPPGRGLG